MTKRQVAETINREIEYRQALIAQAKSGILLHLDTPDKIAAYVGEQEYSISEAKWIAFKLHVSL